MGKQAQLHRLTTSTLRTVAVAIFFFAAAVILPPQAMAAPKADLWPRWEAADPQSAKTVDHTPWGAFLNRYLTDDDPSGISLIDYAGVDKADHAMLGEYIGILERTAVSTLNRAEQQAYWINLYNALTVKVILDKYPVDSIRDIRSGWFSSGPWDLKLIEIEGHKLTLNDIEHRILRPIWKDMRVHFAVNCASIGCPNLAAVPYTADNMEALLDEGARAYINHPRGVSLAGGKLTLSSIFDWFASDFGANEGEVIKTLLPYAAPELAKQLESYKGRVGYRYDWALNKK